MGHKVNPHGMRIGISSNWKSQWITSKANFARYLLEDQRIRQTIIKLFGKEVGIDLVEIKRSVQELSVAIHTAKPGMIIGRAGQGVENLKRKVQAIITPELKLKIDIHEVKSPDLSAAIVAANIAHQIERRISYRRASKQAIERTLGKGAKGIRIAISGRLGGAEIARREKFSAGSVPLSTFRADIDYAQVDAQTTYGVIGVKVWIFKGEKTTPLETQL